MVVQLWCCHARWIWPSRSTQIHMPATLSPHNLPTAFHNSYRPGGFEQAYSLEAVAIVANYSLIILISSVAAIILIGAAFAFYHRHAIQTRNGRAFSILRVLVSLSIKTLYCWDMSSDVLLSSNLIEDFGVLGWLSLGFTFLPHFLISLVTIHNMTPPRIASLYMAYMLMDGTLNCESLCCHILFVCISSPTHHAYTHTHTRTHNTHTPQHRCVHFSNLNARMHATKLNTCSCTRSNARTCPMNTHTHTRHIQVFAYPLTTFLRKHEVYKDSWLLLLGVYLVLGSVMCFCLDLFIVIRFAFVVCQ